MAGGKQTPRQRMINILYLVLLGLIALNVPDNLLDAFKKIGDSLSNSNKNVQAGLNTTYSTFEQTRLKQQADRAKPIYEKAKKATELSDELFNYVEELKKHLIDNTGGLDEKTGDYKGRDNMDVTPNFMITNGKAAELKKKINDTRNQLLDVLDVKDREGIQLSLDAEDPKNPRDGKNTWELANFGEGIPMGAAITQLIKIQSDVKNAESEVVKKELGKIDVAQVTLDQFKGVAVAPSSYILVGQPYTAQIFLTAYDSKSNPSITINGSPITVKDGIGSYSVLTGKEGEFTYSGDLAVKGPDGVKHYTLAPQKYQVAKPSAVVSPDKMNVLYIGVDNPLSISAPSIPLEDLRVSISSGSVSGSKGHFSARVTSVGDAKITISAELEKGKAPKVLCVSPFRVKRIPDPIARFAGKSSGSTPAVNIRSQDRVFAILDNFEFDAKFTVTRFTLFIQKPRQDFIIIKGTGNELNAQMKAAMAGVTPGTKVLFDDITAVGPDGGIRGLQPIILTAN